jgi:hypothetical protein
MSSNQPTTAQQAKIVSVTGAVRALGLLTFTRWLIRLLSVNVLVNTVLGEMSFLDHIADCLFLLILLTVDLSFGWLTRYVTRMWSFVLAVIAAFSIDEYVVFSLAYNRWAFWPIVIGLFGSFVYIIGRLPYKNIQLLLNVQAATRPWRNTSYSRYLLRFGNWSLIGISSYPLL